MASPGLTDYELAFVVSPIYLTGGLAGTVPGGTVPLISYTEGAIFDSLTAAGTARDVNRFFAHFMPVPGSTLVKNAIGQYPFANQSVAANAIIFEPLTVSMMMICPAKSPGDHRQRQALFASLKRTIDSHNLAGGTYSIATPSYLYVDCVFVQMTDASAGETRQAQYRYQLDFLQPLVTQKQAQQSYNNQMSKIGSQTQLAGASWSGAGSTVGDPASGAAASVVPPNKTDPGLGFAPASSGIEQGSFGSVPDTAAAFSDASASGAAVEQSGAGSNVSVPSALP